MKTALLATIIATTLLAGCSSVPMESKETTDLAKEFNAPSKDTAGIYVYRKDTFVGAALKKDVWIGKDCVGETAKGVFFYKEVPANEKLEVSTESEFSPNTLTINAKSGELYFVEQFIKMGAFVGGADLELAHAESGKSEVLRLGMAKGGNCSSVLQ
ncbi:DUF2846 domain-containing protein [Thalassotalea sp. ND16A]|uniref:DUF2846 domain-containing protein n=1 Tax=Thalassotalea sp. ND16A TaxID=1535422 RepID=UPI00051A7917|nr:DUF2846 domain-containing protein [Thalassotalea sp. ND16A]KGJ88004.1 hypothetical protein ND16A_2557 [Thalassotalea sp. ND16A]